MKKIKTYLNEHKKLKRIIKLFAVILIALSVIFNGVIIGSVIAYNVKSNNDNNYRQNSLIITTPLAHEQTKYAIDSQITTYCMFGPNDWASSEMLLLLNGFLGQYFSASLFSTYSYVYNYPINGLYPFEYVYNEHSSLTPVTPLTNNEVVLSKWELLSFYGNGHGFGYIELQGTNNYQLRIFFRVYTEGATQSGQQYQRLISSAPMISRDSWATMDYAPEYQYFRLDRFNDLYKTCIKQFGKEYGSYQEGYNTGVAIGQSIATEGVYNNGYNDGYYDGYNAGSTGVTNNPFELIANAFSSIASILNIQVLPNLSLGVLLFTPLIVTLIIVIVKMVRG